ncbi:hypothetical protein GCM10022422_10510 [Flavobacterium ginsengisoli]|uniref:Uncharacterized protein n=1 Tax=Flavobacterium ginsengisoli TaxID=871694 RepID=A0ABP7F307_9FLAO
MDNKTPLAVSASTYAIKQSIKNETVKTKNSQPYNELKNFVLLKKIMLNSVYQNIPENKFYLRETK